jgi:hypothetical protein
MKKKTKWPTLKDRLANPIKTRQQAVKQLKEAGIELTQLAKKYLK